MIDIFTSGRRKSKAIKEKKDTAGYLFKAGFDGDDEYMPAGDQEPAELYKFTEVKLSAVNIGAPRFGLQKGAYHFADTLLK